MTKLKITKLDLEAMQKAPEGWFNAAYYCGATRCDRLVKLGMMEIKKTEHKEDKYSFYTAEYRKLNALS